MSGVPVQKSLPLAEEDCDKSEELFERVVRASDEYAKVANYLCANMATMQESEYVRVRAAIEHRRLTAERARRRLQQHENSVAGETASRGREQDSRV